MSNRPIVEYSPTGKKIKHGWSGYLKYRCRCETCRAAKNKHQKRYRDRRRGISEAA